MYLAEGAPFNADERVVCDRVPDPTAWIESLRCHGSLEALH